MTSTLFIISFLSLLFATWGSEIDYEVWDLVRAARLTGCFVPFSSLEEVYCQVWSDNFRAAPVDLDTMLGKVSTRVAIPSAPKGHVDVRENSAVVKIIRFNVIRGSLSISKALFPFSALKEVTILGAGSPYSTIIIDPEAFKHNYQLSELFFDSVDLFTTDFEQLLSPLSSSLQSLTMPSSYNGTDLNIAAGLKVLTKLNHLQISGTDLYEFPDLRNSAATLTHLELSWTRIKGPLKAEYLRNMVNLEFLSLSLNRLHSIENGTFSNLTKLYYLDLSSNDINNFTPEMFKNNQQLEYLNLVGNPSPAMTCKSVQQVLPKLTELYVVSYQANCIVG